MNSSKQSRSVRQEKSCNKHLLRELLAWALPEGELFDASEFHGNIKWQPEQLLAQALLWAWQEARHITDAFEQTRDVCDELGLNETIVTYTAFMNALTRYAEVLATKLKERYWQLAEEVGGEQFRTHGWVVMGFDGSRITAPRTVSNEQAFCAPNYGKGKRSRYGKKKSKGLRRKRNKAQKTQPQAPQVWITMMWHVGLRLPWTWKLGPSNSSERDHVKQMLRQEPFPNDTLFCGDAGFTGYPLWSLLLESGHEFLIRVGSNVSLLSEHADVKQSGDGTVLCWPKGRMDSGDPPLRLRLVQVKVGKTDMWMLTSVQSKRKLSRKRIAEIYALRWGIEVEFRGLKQTIDKHMLRCRNSNRLLTELDWSIRAMGFAELFALREQLSLARKTSDSAYTPKHRSLARTMRALRKCMRQLHKPFDDENNLRTWLSEALVQQYKNRTDKRARYKRKNPDKNPLGEPTVNVLTSAQRQKLRLLTHETAG